jgi:heme/copper-type cytochrome/quinol oxidase subunit 2
MLLYYLKCTWRLERLKLQTFAKELWNIIIIIINIIIIIIIIIIILFYFILLLVIVVDAFQKN